MPEIVWNSNIAFFNRKIDNSRDRRTKGSAIVHVLDVCVCVCISACCLCMSFFDSSIFICAFVFVYFSLPCSIRSQHDDRINWFFVFFFCFSVHSLAISPVLILFFTLHMRLSVCACVRVSISTLTLIPIVSIIFHFDV